MIKTCQNDFLCVGDDNSIFMFLGFNSLSEWFFVWAGPCAVSFLFIVFMVDVKKKKKFVFMLSVFF